MAIVSVPVAGTQGINLDIAPYELPVGAFSATYNIRFGNASAFPVRAALDICDYRAPPDDEGESQEVRWMMPVGTFDVLSVWVVASQTRLYGLEAGKLVEITRVDSDGNPVPMRYGIAPRWNGCVLSTVGIFNNFMDIPQVWPAPDLRLKCFDLPAWQPQWRCQALRAYKGYLIALDFVKDMDHRYPQMVKWSHVADPGSWPTSWDETDPTKDAGETHLADTPGRCVDCLTLKDTNIIYKTDSVWGMQYIGGLYIFKFYKIFGDFGMPNRDCAVEFEAGWHFVFTGSDVIVHNGVTAESVGTDRVRSLFARFSIQQLAGVFCVMDRKMQEVWVCFNSDDKESRRVNRALVWCWRNKAFSMRMLGHDSTPGLGLTWLIEGRYEIEAPPARQWEDMQHPWPEETEPWTYTTDVPTVGKGIGSNGKTIFGVDEKPFCPWHTYLERKQLAFGINKDMPDPTIRKFFSRCWPRFSGKQGSKVFLHFGYSDNTSDEIRWDAARVFVIGETNSVSLLKTARYISYRIESEQTTPWEFHGIDFEVQPAGKSDVQSW